LTHRIEWSRDDSEFESLTLSESDDSSSGYKSMIPEDLDLYEDGCVCQFPIELHALKHKHI
jgi:hypothetical protein